MHYLMSYLTAPIVLVVTYLLITLLSYFISQPQIDYFTSDWQIIDILTLTGYGLALSTFFLFYKTPKTNKEKISYLSLFILTLVALLRELGAQHWIPSKDTTAFKIKFFTSPYNPLSEKVIAGLILICVATCFLTILCLYTKKLFVSFFQKNCFSWTIATLGASVVLSKIIDRFPSNYRKHYGQALQENYRALCSLYEESGEVLIPFFILLALYQYHNLRKNIS